jgi:hypothetical protein
VGRQNKRGVGRRGDFIKAVGRRENEIHENSLHKESKINK